MKRGTPHITNPKSKQLLHKMAFMDWNGGGGGGGRMFLDCSPQSKTSWNHNKRKKRGPEF